MSGKKSSPRIYGPVPSRRYGLSLGIDLLPGKVCSYDCVYCQVGRTQRLQVAREDFFPVAAVLAEVEQALTRGPAPDVVTLAGSGDASLVRSLGPLLEGMKQRMKVPIVLLTNGGLLWRPEVRAAMRLADVLAPSLDAGDEETFRRVNRPHPDITFDRMVEGLRRTVAEHPGTVRLEVMIVPGFNDAPEQIDRLAALAVSLGAASIDLNTPVRPAPGREVRPLGAEALASLLPRFGPRAQVVAAFSRAGAAVDRAPALSQTDTQRVLAALGRRPCTAEDLAHSMGLDPGALTRSLAGLMAQGAISRQQHSGLVYFFAAGDAGEEET